MGSDGMEFMEVGKFGQKDKKGKFSWM